MSSFGNTLGFGRVDSQYFFTIVTFDYPFTTMNPDLYF